jgi:chromosome partitioning protein
LAVEAAKEGSVWIADLDPQQSTAKWWQRRKGPENPMLVQNFPTLSEAVQRLTDRNKLRDFLIVDSPGSLINVIDDSVSTADCIIFALKPSQKDLEARGALEDLIRKHKKQSRTLYALTMVDGRAGLGAEAASKLSKLTGKQIAIIGNRADYVRADAQGRTGPELSKDCAGEIAELWQAVKGIALHDEKVRKAGRV